MMTYIDHTDWRSSQFTSNGDSESLFSTATHPAVPPGSFLPNMRLGFCPGCWNQYNPSFLDPCNGLCPTCANTRSVTTAPPAVENESNYDSFMMSHMIHVVNDVLREDCNNGGAVDKHRPTICSGCGASSKSLSYCARRGSCYCSSCMSLGQYFDAHSSESLYRTQNGFSTPSPPIPSPKQLDMDDPSPTDVCEQHPCEKLVHLCKTCGILVCSKCVTSTHKQHTHTAVSDEYREVVHNVDSLLHKTAIEMTALDRYADATERMREKVIKLRKDAVARVQQIFQAHKEAVLQKENEVIAQIMSIGDLRLDALSKEKRSAESDLEKIKQLASRMKDANNYNHSAKASLVLSHHQLSNELNKEDKKDVAEVPVEDASFMIQSNSSLAHSALDTLCTITTAPYPPLCTAVGDGLFHPRMNRLCTIVVYTKDRGGEPCHDGGKHLTVQIKARSDSSHNLPADILDNQDGSCSITFRPRLKGEHQMVIAVRGHHIQGSPFTLSVCGGREYNRFGMVSSVFGSEGKENGQFCRPWGICCDQHGNIIVGDRSNHRIQVFDSNGAFKHAFGTEGVRPGQFNRPAGVAVNREGNIVIADKDNHRIQIFKLDGTFVSAFGSKGGNDGQMIYPYDVAVNHIDGRIAVTDTGNHRILIFNHEGQLLGKFGYKGYLCGHFDSPRGISFNDEGHIIISDFNVHHVLVIHPEGTTARILGSHGSGNGQFLRPQGIAVDHMGNFVVADTRNNRIVIMYPNGQFIAKFGGSGTSPGQFDRPTSVCVLPDGRIAVVDFGNSRIQIF